MAIQTGSIVWLKTGDTAMTVKGKSTSGDWICNWQIKGKPYTELYTEEQLTETEPEEED